GQEIERAEESAPPDILECHRNRNAPDQARWDCQQGISEGILIGLEKDPVFCQLLEVCETDILVHAERVPVAKAEIERTDKRIGGEDENPDQGWCNEKPTGDVVLQTPPRQRSSDGQETQNATGWACETRDFSSHSTSPLVSRR